MSLTERLLRRFDEVACDANGLAHKLKAVEQAHAAFVAVGRSLLPIVARVAASMTIAARQMGERDANGVPPPQSVQGWWPTTRAGVMPRPARTIPARC